MRNDDEVRAEFIQLFEQLGGTGAEKAVMNEVGFHVSRATFYKVKDGKCKPTLLHLLTYVLKNAINKGGRYE